MRKRPGDSAPRTEEVGRAEDVLAGQSVTLHSLAAWPLDNEHHQTKQSRAGTHGHIRPHTETSPRPQPQPTWYRCQARSDQTQTGPQSRPRSALRGDTQGHGPCERAARGAETPPTPRNLQPAARTPSTLAHIAHSIRFDRTVPMLSVVHTVLRPCQGMMPPPPGINEARPACRGLRCGETNSSVCPLFCLFFHPFARFACLSGVFAVRLGEASSPSSGLRHADFFCSIIEIEGFCCCCCWWWWCSPHHLRSSEAGPPGDIIGLSSAKRLPRTRHERDGKPLHRNHCSRCGDRCSRRGCRLRLQHPSRGRPGGCSVQGVPRHRSMCSPQALPPSGG